MYSGKLKKWSLGLAVLLGISLNVAIAQSAVSFDVETIEKEIVQAVNDGQDPVLAAKAAVANAVRAIIAANPDYPGGEEALTEAIFEALDALTIPGLDDTDLLLAANHALGITVDPELEAYESPIPGALAPVTTARNVNGPVYGPRANVIRASPI